MGPSLIIELDEHHAAETDSGLARRLRCESTSNDDGRASNPQSPLSASFEMRADGCDATTSDGPGQVDRVKTRFEFDSLAIGQRFLSSGNMQSTQRGRPAEPLAAALGSSADIVSLERQSSANGNAERSWGQTAMPRKGSTPEKKQTPKRPPLNSPHRQPKNWPKQSASETAKRPQQI
jgi:hypothetical protein